MQICNLRSLLYTRLFKLDPNYIPDNIDESLEHPEYLISIRSIRLRYLRSEAQLQINQKYIAFIFLN